MAPLEGRFLLVEDNLINQGVAKAMLAKLGPRYALADNGVEAIECVRQEVFGLVLMDCQMPVMDIYEATAAIRALPGGRGAKLAGCQSWRSWLTPCPATSRPARTRG